MQSFELAYLLFVLLSDSIHDYLIFLLKFFQLIICLHDLLMRETFDLFLLVLVFSLELSLKLEVLLLELDKFKSILRLNLLHFFLDGIYLHARVHIN